MNKKHVSFTGFSRFFFRIFTFLLIILFAACSAPSNRTVVKLELKDIAGKWVYLCQWTENNSQIIDSAKVNSKGRAQFKVTSNSPEIFAITVDKVLYPIILQTEPMETIFVTGNLTNYNVIGSGGSAVLKSLQDSLARVRGKIWFLQDQLSDSAVASSDSLVKLINLKIDSLTSGFRNLGLSYIKSNPFSLTSAILLSTSMDSANSMFPYEQYRNYYIKVDSCLNLVYADKPIVQSFHKVVQSKENFFQLKDKVKYDVGENIPPIEFALIDGRTVNVPGIWARLILIDFWADWCSTCKNRSSQLKEIYKDFGGKGLLVIQFSAGLNSDSLKALALRDTLSWMHASLSDSINLKIPEILGVVEVPSNYLIDRWGRIIAKNIYGEELVDKLHKMLDVKPVKKPAVVDSVSSPAVVSE